MTTGFEVAANANDMTPSQAINAIERFQEAVRDAKTTTISVEVDFCGEILDAIVALLIHAQAWRITDGLEVIAPPECAPEGPLSGDLPSKAPESGAHSLPGSGAALPETSEQHS